MNKVLKSEAPRNDSIILKTYDPFQGLEESLKKSRESQEKFNLWKKQKFIDINSGKIQSHFIDKELQRLGIFEECTLGSEFPDRSEAHQKYKIIFKNISRSIAQDFKKNLISPEEADFLKVQMVLTTRNLHF